MPRVIIAPSAMNPALRSVQQFDGDVEAFVRGKYPNVRRWHFDHDGADHYAIGIPADPASATFFGLTGWSAIFASIATSVALSFVAGKLLAKKPPLGVNRATDSPSPTYGIGGLQNQARLGAIIPVIYGEVTMLPDYAAQPYMFFENNEQYLRAIYCVGQGVVDVTKMFIGETDVGALGPDVVNWKVFQPADHASTFGTIEAATKVEENIFSNSEVADQTLEPPDPAGGPIVPADWHWVQGRRVDGANYHEADLLTIPRPAIGSTVDVYVRLPSGGLQEHEFTAVAGAGVAGPGVIIPNPVNSSLPKAIGPFDMCKPSQTGTEASVDFVFPGGLYTQNTTTGGFLTRHSVVKVIFYPIDANGASTGPAIEYDHTFTGTTNTPQRYTLTFPLPAGRYRCSAERTTPKDVSPTVIDEIVWTGMKFKLTPPTHPVYGNVTLVAATIKATNGIASDATGKVRFRCRRKLQTLDGTTETFTANPADVMIDILTAKYGGRRPMTADELDLDEMRRSRNKWARHNGFNAVFDKMTTVWDAMSSAVAVVAAVPLPQGSRVSMAHDSVKDYRAALFTDENIVAGSLQVNYEFDKIGDPTSTKVEYRTQEWFDPDYVQVPPDRDDFDSVNLFGCTSRDVAEQHATLTNNRRRLRRKTIQFETELDGALVMHGQRIGVAHSTPRWGQSAAVVSRHGDTLTMNTIIDWSIPNLTMLIRDVEGYPHQIDGIKQGANPKEVVLPSPPSFLIPTIDGGYEGAVAAFGERNHEVKDWIVLSMEPTGDFRIRISAAEYRPDVYVNAMPHQLIDSTVNP